MARFTNPPAQGGGGNGSNIFDTIEVTNNGAGINVKVGDDAYIGDVNLSNQIGITGIQDPTQGGIVFGNGLMSKIYTDGSGMTLEANSGDMNFWMDGAAYIGDSLEENRIAQMKDLNSVPTYLASGSFHDQTTFGPYTANSEQALSYQTTDWANGVRIAGINNSEITFDTAGKFNIQFSTQFHVTSSGALVFVWLKKNGVTVPWTGTRFDITANNPYAVAAWNWFVDAAVNDYYEIFWSSVQNTVKVESITGLTGTKATVPSNILTVNQVG